MSSFNKFQLLDSSDSEEDQSINVPQKTFVYSSSFSTSGIKAPSSTPVEGFISCSVGTKQRFERVDLNRSAFDDEEEICDSTDDENEFVKATYGFHFSCLFKKCSTKVTEFVHPDALLDHLKHVHRLVIHDIDSVIVHLVEYITYWIERLEKTNDFGECLGKIKLDKSYFLIGDNEEDNRLREKLQKRKLVEILKIQEDERNSSAKQRRKCLFCKVVSGNRQALFKHMFLEHNFNIGLADNLVMVDEFLDVLNHKLHCLSCLYCEKVFKTRNVLRTHMRKKKHFKINPKNSLYDKYYVVNYLEKGNVESPPDSDESDKEEKSSDDWDDWEDEPQTIKCFFDEERFLTMDEVLNHLKMNHSFDLQELLEENVDFYSKVKIVNFIRSCAASTKCISCSEVFDNVPCMERHMKNEHTGKRKLHPSWNSSKFMFPVLENDAMLCSLEDADDRKDTSLNEDSLLFKLQSL
jgi:hypothetical protein